MTKSIDELDLFGPICSVSWSLTHWQVKQVFGEPVARVVARLALPRYIPFRQLILSRLEQMSRVELASLVLTLLPRKRRRKFLKTVKHMATPQMRQLINSPFLQEFRREFEKSLRQAFDYSTGDRELIVDRLYPELQCDWNTLCADPSRAEKAFPMQILKSPREQRRLLDELPAGHNSYGRELITFLYELATNPYALDLPGPRQNDLLFEMVEQRPSDNLTGDQTAKAFVRLLKAVSSIW